MVPKTTSLKDLFRDSFSSLIDLTWYQKKESKKGYVAVYFVNSLKLYFSAVIRPIIVQ